LGEVGVRARLPVYELRSIRRRFTGQFGLLRHYPNQRYACTTLDERAG